MAQVNYAIGSLLSSYRAHRRRPGPGRALAARAHGVTVGGRCHADLGREAIVHRWRAWDRWHFPRHVADARTRKLLMPQGWYVVVRRFSSKEERHRIIASVLNPQYLPHDFYGFENHLNVFHFEKQGLESNIAYGLALFLNATITDLYFRTFNGHTQVNATDLRSMRFPSKKTLEHFGKWARARTNLDQMKIDNFIESYAGAK